MIKKWATACLFFISANIYSQAIDDFGTWWGVEIRKTFLDDFRVSMRAEARLNENSGNLKNIYLNPSFRYSPLKWLSVGVGYRFDNRYQQADRYFDQRHRINIDLEFTYEVKKFQFDYRTRFQMHWENYFSSKIEYPIMFYRNQIGGTYNWKQLPFSSSISGELWLPIETNTELSKFRLVVAQEYKYKKKHRFQLRFIFQTDLGNGSPWRDYIISTRYIFAF